ncbi:MAG: type II toxin-antitoxin system RelE/ParE family toxin [Candidatus Nanopelagicales bacterium]|nr:type II toxin-antitoxin system RelE/ParE family toxin [Candidatus Nanopelagicales bacterium]
MQEFYSESRQSRWVVVVVVEVASWIQSLDRSAYDRISDGVEALSEFGPTLGRPLVDRIHGSKFANMRELRIGTFRILFAFDPARNAVLLLAGDKQGEWNNWYRRAIPIADQRFEDWLHAREEERP